MKIGEVEFVWRAHRQACAVKIGGTMPEDLPTPEKSIAQLEKEQLQRLKQQALDGQLMLDE